ncbi:MAG: dTMP kinase [Kofleriaceae bacterium]|jgi:dTMP kinase|nr:dTMP kinase [Kofleriaceae bacterium]MBP6841237.1 dTMP kinase [Kofleriaceae bacterium]MBP9204697.1 dTMP kinase [Kofleriaceae bacterium]
MAPLIVLEGLDGAGTTSQAQRLATALTAAGHRVHVTREPSDGPIGRLLRAMLTGQHALEGQALDQSMFSLLFAADRMDHLQREVEPALAAGAIVISDRWYHSSLAYQGTGAERAWIRTLNQRARVPDLTLLLRVRAEVAAARRHAAGRSQELFEDLAMQERVAAGYDAVMADLAAAGQPITILDGEQPLDAVTAAIVAAVTPVLPAAG